MIELRAMAGTTDPRQHANFRGAGCLFTRIRDSLQSGPQGTTAAAGGYAAADFPARRGFPGAPLDRPMSRVYYCALSGAHLVHPPRRSEW
jgi:hypothetical protein